MRKSTLKESEFTVSEKVRFSTPSFMSSEKPTNTGSVVSGITSEAGSGLVPLKGTTFRPDMSTIVSAVMDKNVLLTEVASLKSLLISFRSPSPKVMEIRVELMLFVPLPPYGGGLSEWM